MQTFKWVKIFFVKLDDLMKLTLKLQLSKKTPLITAFDCVRKNSEFLTLDRQTWPSDFIFWKKSTEAMWRY